MPEPLPGFHAPPTRLVEQGRQQLGRFDGPVPQVNLLDARYHGLPRVLRWWRLKEWHALQISTPRLFVNLALFDAKLMSLLQVKIYDKAQQTKLVYERKLAPGAFRVADSLLDSRTHYSRKGAAMSFHHRVERGRIDVELDVEATRTTPRISGHIAVHVNRGASHVVSLPFAGDGGMYSHKGMFPVEGALRVGDETHALSPNEALGLLDDHKGYYPYVMQWDWVTSAAWHDGQARGINLTRNQCREPERYNENCAWEGDRVGILPAVTFERHHVRAAGERWKIRDREGRVDVTFEPTVPGDVKVNALVVESRYRGPFGVFSGRVEPQGLAPFSVEGWFGMGEAFWLRC